MLPPSAFHRTALSKHILPSTPTFPLLVPYAGAVSLATVAGHRSGADVPLHRRYSSLVPLRRFMRTRTRATLRRALFHCPYWVVHIRCSLWVGVGTHNLNGEGLLVLRDLADVGTCRTTHLSVFVRMPSCGGLSRFLLLSCLWTMSCLLCLPVTLSGEARSELSRSI